MTLADDVPPLDQEEAIEPSVYHLPIGFISPASQALLHDLPLPIVREGAGTAIAWGTGWTFAGGLASLVISVGLVKTFTSAIVGPDAGASDVVLPNWPSDHRAVVATVAQ